MKLHWKLLSIVALVIVLTTLAMMISSILVMWNREAGVYSMWGYILALLATMLAVLAVLLPISYRIFNRMIIFPLMNIVTLTGSSSTADWIKDPSSLSEKNLSKMLQTDRKDEMGQFYEGIYTILLSVGNLIGNISHSEQKVTAYSSDLVETAREQEINIKTQVASTHNVLNSFEEISDVMQNLIRAMEEVAFLSESFDTAFGENKQTDLARMADAMLQMEKASKSISGKLEAINEKAENITTVVTTITRVAEQTNLLSLNAAIEAVKAGENGRGFTVVAREIRRLADQTAVATLDIGKMVKEMQSAVSSGVMEMDKFIAEVRQRTEDVKQFSAKLIQIIKQVQTLSPRFENVNEEMAHLNKDMQSTSDALRGTFMTITQLNDAARELQNQMTNS